MPYFFLSFARGTTTRGACQVVADDMRTAHQKTHTLGINPGGEVLITGMTEPQPKLEMDRLYTFRELKALGYAQLKDAPADVQERHGVPPEATG